MGLIIVSVFVLGNILHFIKPMGKENLLLN